MAEEFSVADAEAYRILEAQTLAKLANEFGISVQVDGQLAAAKSPEVATWLGDLWASGYPNHYAKRYRSW